MAVCVLCDGKGFILSDGLCNECNGTGESDYNDDDILFDDDSENIPLINPFEPKLYQYHEYSSNLPQANEREQLTSAR